MSKVRGNDNPHPIASLAYIIIKSAALDVSDCLVVGMLPSVSRTDLPANAMNSFVRAFTTMLLDTVDL